MRILKVMRKKTSLHKLVLNYSESKERMDVQFQNLKKGLRKMRSLESLSLDLHDCNQINHFTVGLLKEVLKTTFSSLKYLSLDFSYCKNMSDVGVNHLKEVLKG